MTSWETVPATLRICPSFFLNWKIQTPIMSSEISVAISSERLNGFLP